MVRWTQARAEHIATRSYRYLDAIDIKVGWPMRQRPIPRR